MTAYLHIGLEKCGSTSIQEFLYINKEKIKEQNYYLVQSIGEKNHWDLAFLGYSLHKQDSYILNYSLNNLQTLLNRKKEILNKLKSEIKDKNNIVFSSELLQSRLDHKKEIKKLHQFLRILGFDTIYIICYLRDQYDMLPSLYSEAFKWGEIDNFKLYEKGMRYESGYKKNLSHFYHICNHKQTLQWWGEVFGKENLIVRLFDKNEFHQNDLLKDFAYSIGLKWDNDFIIPSRQNESLDLIGIEILSKINSLLPLFTDNQSKSFRGNLHDFIQKYFSLKDPLLKFQPPKDIIQVYLEHFKASNEWVRKEFFPHKERLFPKKDLNDYKENYELKEMKPEYWHKIAHFIAGMVRNKNCLLSFYNKYGSAKQRVENHLAYKLGQTLIINSKSVFNILFMPVYIISTVISYKQEQKAYKIKIKKNPYSVLPPLESYPDYDEALKEKECFTYKLGEAFIKASKKWYKGGYFKFIFKDIPRLRKEFRKRK